MGISVCVDVVEHNKFKESFHIHHPRRYIFLDGCGDIFIATRVFEFPSVFLLVLPNHCGKIFQEHLGSIRKDIKTLGNINHLTLLGKA